MVIKKKTTDKKANNMKSIEIKKEDSFKPVYLDIYDDNLFFYETFRRAATVIKGIVDRSRAFQKSSKEERFIINYPNNILAFCADRGQGKTTALISMAKALSDYSCSRSKSEVSEYWHSIGFYEDKYNGNILNIRFEVLDIIDPTMMNDKDSILRTVISKMYRSVSMLLKDKMKYVNEREVLIKKEELVESFLSCFKAIDNVYTDSKAVSFFDTYEDLSRISEIGDNITVKREFSNLVEKYLKFIQEINKDNSEYILVIQIDDADLNTKYAFEIAEEIRKYLIIPNVIVMMALHVGTLSRTIQQHYIEEYKTLLDSKTKAITYDRCHNMMERYIEKLIPASHQLYVPSVNSSIKNHYNEITIKWCGEKDDLLLLFERSNDLDYQSILMSFLYKKTGIALIKPDDYLHNFLPSNMRELSQFLAYFDKLDDVLPSKENGFYDGFGYILSKCKKLNPSTVSEIISFIDANLVNIRYLFEYFHNNWCTMHLNDAEIQIMSKISSEPLNTKNRTAVEQIKYFLIDNKEENKEEIRIHEQDYSRYPHTPLSDVIYTLYNIKRLENPQKYYKLISAVEMYYNIYMRQLAFAGLKKWLKNSKNGEPPVGSPFADICKLTEYKIFPDLYYSLMNPDPLYSVKRVFAEENTKSISNTLKRFLRIYCCPANGDIVHYEQPAYLTSQGEYYAYVSRFLTTYLDLDDFYHTFYIEYPDLWELIPNLLDIVCNMDFQKILYHSYFNRNSINDDYEASGSLDFFTDIKHMIDNFDTILNQEVPKSSPLYHFEFDITGSFFQNKQNYDSEEFKDFIRFEDVKYTKTNLFYLKSNEK